MNTQGDALAETDRVLTIPNVISIVRLARLKSNPTSDDGAITSPP